MLLERFVNRTATKAPMVNTGLEVDEKMEIGVSKSYWD